MDKDVLPIPVASWDQARNVSEGSLSASSEQYALIDFAHRLCSTALNSEPGIANENDVRKEARLLMSLSCSSPNNIIEESGRITPTSDASSCHSSSSKRDTFTFVCPSLSLENYSKELEGESKDEKEQKAEEKPHPALLLGRVLKVDDKDALRLSSEAMARNVMQSYHKAIEWRIQSWADSLSRMLAHKERSMKQEGASAAEIKELLMSSEALLLLNLREIEGKIQVLDATTSFKVLPQKVTMIDATEPANKRQRLSKEDNSTLEEGEYEYHVGHAMMLEGVLNIKAPGVGYIQIELEVPGSMKGTFLSSETHLEQLTDILVEVNTDILASMIETSSRKVVRACIEAAFAGEPEKTEEEEAHKKQRAVEQECATTPMPNSTPKRRVSNERVSSVVVITPRDTSSPSSFGDSDHDEKPGIPSIPDDFSDEHPRDKPRILTPQPSRPIAMTEVDFTGRLPMRKSLPAVITPQKSAKPSIEGSTEDFPFLVEVACAAIHKK